LSREIQQSNKAPRHHNDNFESDKRFIETVAELRDFKIKAKYLAFISCLLEKPDLSVKTALKSIFRKSQVRTISEKFGLNLNAQIVCLSPSQWLNCFLEMLEVVPEKFHPS
ncbi:MAG: rRNA adenine N-6-methyltransferase family protein, partial [Bacteroides faecis]|nr:rRNA adenine N-6-methyltransferase family protein [Bacteroides faecis]